MVWEGNGGKRKFWNDYEWYGDEVEKGMNWRNGRNLRKERRKYNRSEGMRKGRGE